MQEKLAGWKTFFGRIWKLAYPYWFSEERWIARALIAAITVLNLSIVFILVIINKWTAVFYNALQSKDILEFWFQLGFFTIYAVLYIIFAVYYNYLTQMLQIHWRRWLTEEYLNRWFKNQSYYRLELEGGDTDNPDQRISQDVAAFTSSTLSYFFGLLNAVVTLFSFIAILWLLSGSLNIPIPGSKMSVGIPGYMVWVALIYAIGGTWLTHLIGHRLVKYNFDLEKFQAHFRYNLVRFRENVEGIAFFQGEADEKRSLLERFQNIWDTWWKLMITEKRLTWFTSAYGQLAIIFPVLVAAPRYFSGEIEFGVIMQISMAFAQVQNSLSWFIGMYTSLADWKASVDRLITFDDRLNSLQKNVPSSLEVQLNENTESDVTVSLNSLSVPQGRVLLKDVNLTFKKGENMIVMGPSGSGKSTFFRALAGIWPYGEGSIRVPDTKIFFLPQKPYLPIASLKNAVTYPSSPGTFDNTTIEEVLTDCHLGHLIPKLDEAANWSQSLSPGEQQRLSFARALLQKPEWLFMDESTSSVDAKIESDLYQLVKSRLPQATLVSIAHRKSVAEFHEKSLNFKPGSDGTILSVETI